MQLATSAVTELKFDKNMEEFFADYKSVHTRLAKAGGSVSPATLGRLFAIECSVLLLINKDQAKLIAARQVDLDRSALINLANTELMSREGLKIYDTVDEMPATVRDVVMRKLDETAKETRTVSYSQILDLCCDEVARRIEDKNTVDSLEETEEE